MQVQDDKPYDDINITPMLDLAYVLLVIFILMTTSTVQGFKAQLPSGSNTPQKKKADDKNKPKVVAIDDAGGIFLDGTPTTIAGLEPLLESIKTSSPDAPVIIKGSSNTQYEAVTDVLALTVKVGLKKVGIATISR
jgi:biopolymer transport protein ExbD